MKTIILFSQYCDENLSIFFENALPWFSAQGEIELLIEENDSANNRKIRQFRAEAEKWLQRAQATEEKSIRTSNNSALECQMSTNEFFIKLFSQIEKHQPDAEVFGIDTYFLKDRNMLLAFPCLFDASIPIRNVEIAKNIIAKCKSKNATTVQIVILGYRHYEVMYQMAVDEGYQFVENNFCFLLLESEEIRDTLFQLDKEKLFLFKTHIIKSNHIFDQKEVGTLLESSMHCPFSYLGARLPEFINSIRQNINRSLKEVASLEDILKRATIVYHKIHFYCEKHPNLNFSTMIQIMIKIIETFFINADGKVPEIALSPSANPGSMNPHDLSLYEPHINQLFPLIIAEFKKQGLLQTIKKAEFTTVINRHLIGFQKSSDESVREHKPANPCSRYSFFAYTATAVGAALVCLALEYYSHDKTSSFRFK